MSDIPDEWKVRMYDTRPIYSWWCVLFGHAFFRYGYEREWHRAKTCRRCRHITAPR